ncbi:hypothetical protein IW262DRAFT_1465185 [Armillaria fumosa]|nr:hypothetical protein IW262DRAFT_1465185 [Armillaria fumosa]
MLTCFADLPEEVPIVPYMDIPVEGEESDSAGSSLALTNLSDTEELKSPATDLWPMPMASPQRPGRAKDPEVSDSKSLTSSRSHNAGLEVDEDGQVPPNKCSCPIEITTNEDSSLNVGSDHSPRGLVHHWSKKQRWIAICMPFPGTYVLRHDSNLAHKCKLTPKQIETKWTSDLMDTDREDADDDDDNCDSSFLEAQEGASQATCKLKTSCRHAGKIFDIEMAYLDKRLHEMKQTADSAQLMSKGAPGTTDSVEQPDCSEVDLVEGSTYKGAVRGSEHPPLICKHALDVSEWDGDLTLKHVQQQGAKTETSIAPDLLQQIITGDDQGVSIIPDDTEQQPEDEQVHEGTYPMPEPPAGVSNSAGNNVIEVSDEDKEPKLLQWQENMKMGLQSYLKEHQPLAAIQNEEGSQCDLLQCVTSLLDTNPESCWHFHGVSTPLEKKSLGRLIKLCQSWLNDGVVAVTFEVFCREYSSWGTAEPLALTSMNAASKVFKNIMKAYTNFGKSDFVLPIHQDNHWILFHLNLWTHRIVCYDSLGMHEHSTTNTYNVHSL